MGDKIRFFLLIFFAYVPPTDCLLKPFHHHFGLVCTCWCQTCWSCSNWLREYPIAPHHAPQVNTPNAAGSPLRHPAFRQTVSQPFNQATLGESPRQQVCQLDAVIRAICLIYPFLMRETNFKLGLECLFQYINSKSAGGDLAKTEQWCQIYRCLSADLVLEFNNCLLINRIIE